MSSSAVVPDPPVSKWPLSSMSALPVVTRLVRMLSDRALDRVLAANLRRH
ncbi:hypothetical protein G9272_02755 [Streptomyces asoensis]|uniref:Uncharacterized protein n=1 Tax=Streptomyces asoensis TaxID=249586 RepID=A0A6M4WHR9_9ACTN|nr:hypothetical protein G9272_02755 [Streptomyces asoensis]